MLEKDVHALVERVAEQLEHLLVDVRVVARRGDRVVGLDPGPRDRVRAFARGRVERAERRGVAFGRTERDRDVVRAAERGGERLRRSAGVERRQRALADDHGWMNSTETCAASVAYGPRPNAKRRPPRAKRSAIARAARASGGASRAKNARRPRRASAARSAMRSASAPVRDRAQHMRGSGSPTSMSIARVPPYGVTPTTVPRVLGAHLADQRTPRRRRRRRAARRSARSRVVRLRRSRATVLRSRCAAGRARAPRTRRAPRRRSGTSVLAQHDAQTAVARELVERGRDAAARRVAHPAHAGRARRDQRARRTARPSACRTRRSASRSSSPRASRIVMP